MTKTEIETLLLDTFKDSFINKHNEFIALPKYNLYFRLEDVKTLLDVQCKIIEWFIRPLTKGELCRCRSVKSKFKASCDAILKTTLDYKVMSELYDMSSNAKVNKDLALKYIESNYNYQAVIDYKTRKKR